MPESNRFLSLRTGSFSTLAGEDPTGATGRHAMTTRRRALAFVSILPAMAAWPAEKVRRIGYLAYGPRPQPGEVGEWDFLIAALRELGYEEGRDYAFDFKVTGYSPDRLATAAAELVASRVDVILVFTDPPVRAAKAATSTIPIVFGNVGEPVANGLVASLAKPGGNLTGWTNVTDELAGKRVELLHALLPSVGDVAVLWNPREPIHASWLKRTEAAARGFRIRVRPIELRGPEDIAPVFEQLGSLRPGALLVMGQLWISRHGAALFGAATRLRLPTVTSNPYNAANGALLSYGAAAAEGGRLTAEYLDRIFKGARPGDLPVQQPTKFALVINLKTADAIGVTVPRDLILRADEVIR